MDCEGSGKADGTKILEWEWHGGNNQKWTIEPHSIKGYYLIRKKNAGKCIDMTGKNKLGQIFHIWTCDVNNKNQVSLTSLIIRTTLY